MNSTTIIDEPTAPAELPEEALPAETTTTELPLITTTTVDTGTTFVVYWLLGSVGVIAVLIFIVGCLYLILRHVNIATKEDPNNKGHQFGVKKGSAPQSSVAAGGGSRERPFAFDKNDILAVSNKLQNPQAAGNSSDSSRTKLTATIPYAATPIQSPPARSPGTEVVKTC